MMLTVVFGRSPTFNHSAQRVDGRETERSIRQVSHPGWQCQLEDKAKCDRTKVLATKP